MEWEKGPSPFLSFFLPCSFHFDEKVSRTEGRNGFLQKKKAHYHGYQVVRSTTLVLLLMTYSPKAPQANLLYICLWRPWAKISIQIHFFFYAVCIDI